MKSRKPKSGYTFWLYDSEGDGMMYYDSQNERDADSIKVLHKYRDENGWYDEVEYVSMGEVTHFAQCKNKKMRPTDEDLDDGCDGDGIYWADDIAWMGNYSMENQNDH